MRLRWAVHVHMMKNINLKDKLFRSNNTKEWNGLALNAKKRKVGLPDIYLLRVLEMLPYSFSYCVIESPAEQNNKLRERFNYLGVNIINY